MNPHSQDEGREPGPVVEHQGSVLGGPGAEVRPGGWGCLPSRRKAGEESGYGDRTEIPCLVFREGAQDGRQASG